MAYENTGYARKKTITITKGSSTYRHDITENFSHNNTIYPELTDDAFAKLSNANYESRRTAFISHLYDLYDGLETDCPDLTVGSVGYNTTLCPLS